MRLSQNVANRKRGNHTWIVFAEVVHLAAEYVPFDEIVDFPFNPRYLQLQNLHTYFGWMVVI